jgi:hypothetical protein
MDSSPEEILLSLARQPAKKGWERPQKINKLANDGGGGDVPPPGRSLFSSLHLFSLVTLCNTYCAY